MVLSAIFAFAGMTFAATENNDVPTDDITEPSSAMEVLNVWINGEEVTGYDHTAPVGSQIKFHVPNAEYISYWWEVPSGESHANSAPHPGNTDQWDSCSVLGNYKFGVVAFQNYDDNNDETTIIKRFDVINVKVYDPNPLGDIRVSSSNGQRVPHNPYSTDEHIIGGFTEIPQGCNLNIKSVNAGEYKVTLTALNELGSTDFTQENYRTTTTYYGENVTLPQNAQGYWKIEVEAQHAEHEGIYVFQNYVGYFHVGDEATTQIVYKLVTSQEEIAEGEEYIVCAATTDKAMMFSTEDKNNKAAGEVDVEGCFIYPPTVDYETITLCDSQFTTDGGEMMYLLEVNNGYLVAAGNPEASKNQNYMRTTTMPGSSAGATVKFIAGENDEQGHVEITFDKVPTGTKAGKYMMYNPQSKIFACYTVTTNKGYEHLRLFKRMEAEIVELPTMMVNGAEVADFSNIEFDGTTATVRFECKENHTVYHKLYRQQVEESDVMRVKAADFVEYTDEITVNKGDCLDFYTVNPEGLRSEVATMVFGAGTSGIATVEAANATSVWYNLQGVRVAAPQKGGIYVKVADGKAVKVIAD